MGDNIKITRFYEDKSLQDQENNARKDYIESLSDLTTNSKPLINTLSIVAGENRRFAKTITGAIESHILKASPEHKLPCLYLLDSVIKNIGVPYIEHFSRCIVKIFTNSFSEGDEQTRRRMFKLRMTWKDIFTIEKLRNLDDSARDLDPNWPRITEAETAPSTVHINPNFLYKNSTTATVESVGLVDEVRKTQESLRKAQEELEKQKKELQEQMKMIERQKIQQQLKLQKERMLAEQSTSEALSKPESSKKKFSSIVKGTPSTEERIDSPKKDRNVFRKMTEVKDKRDKRKLGKAPVHTEEENMLPPPKTKKTARKSVSKLPRIPKISASTPPAAVATSPDDKKRPRGVSDSDGSETEKQRPKRVYPLRSRNNSTDAPDGPRSDNDDDSGSDMSVEALPVTVTLQRPPPPSSRPSGRPSSRPSSNSRPRPPEQVTRQVPPRPTPPISPIKIVNQSPEKHYIPQRPPPPQVAALPPRPPPPPVRPPAPSGGAYPQAAPRHQLRAAAPHHPAHLSPRQPGPQPVVHMAPQNVAPHHPQPGPRNMAPRPRPAPQNDLNSIRRVPPYREAPPPRAARAGSLERVRGPHPEERASSLEREAHPRDGPRDGPRDRPDNRRDEFRGRDQFDDRGRRPKGDFRSGRRERDAGPPRRDDRDSPRQDDRAGRPANDRGRGPGPRGQGPLGPRSTAPTGPRSTAPPPPPADRNDRSSPHVDKTASTEKAPVKFYGIELEEVTSVPQSDLPEFVAFSSDSPVGSPKPAVPAVPAEKFEIDRKPAPETKRKVPHPFLICADPNFIGFSDEEEEEVEEEDFSRGRGGQRGGRGFGPRGPGGPANYYDGPRGRRGDWGGPRRGRGDFDHGFRGGRYPYNGPDWRGGPRGRGRGGFEQRGPRPFRGRGPRPTGEGTPPPDGKERPLFNHPYVVKDHYTANQVYKIYKTAEEDLYVEDITEEQFASLKEHLIYVVPDFHFPKPPKKFNRSKRGGKPGPVPRLDVSSLLDRLMEHNLVKMPPVKLTSEYVYNLNKDPIITALYDGNQCSSCGQRFDEVEMANMNVHLDWHYYVNKKTKGGLGIPRRWYVSNNDWVNSSVSNAVPAESTFHTGHEEERREEVVEECTMLEGDTETCVICEDRLLQEYNQKEDEWYFVSCTRREEDNKVCHDKCLVSSHASPCNVTVALEATLDESMMEDSLVPRSRIDSFDSPTSLLPPTSPAQLAEASLAENSVMLDLLEKAKNALAGTKREVRDEVPDPLSLPPLVLKTEEVVMKEEPSPEPAPTEEKAVVKVEVKLEVPEAQETLVEPVMSVVEEAEAIMNTVEEMPMADEIQKEVENAILALSEDI